MGILRDVVVEQDAYGGPDVLSATGARGFSPPRWSLVALGVCVGVLLSALTRRSLIDDAYITMDYARTFAEHGVWGLEPGLVSNTATSPLNVVLLSIVTFVTGSPLVAVGVVLALSFALLGASVGGACDCLGWSRWFAVAAVLVLGTSPLLVSTIGLETYLVVAIVAALVRAATAERPGLAGIAAGVLVLVRLDLVMFVIAALAAPTLLRRAPRFLLTGIVVALPWFLVSWWFLGSAVPDTLLLKAGDQWGPWTYLNGLLLYSRVYPEATYLSVVPAGLGIVVGLFLLGRSVARRSGRLGGVVAILGGGAALHAIAFTLLHTAPYHWYYGPALGAASLLGVLGLAELPRLVRGVGLVGSGALVVVAGIFLGRHDWATAPITTNWATPDQYRAAAALAPPGAVVASPGEIGTLAYYCDCTVVDQFSDRGRIDNLIHDRTAEAGPVFRALLEANYARLRTEAPLRQAYQFVVDPAVQGVPIGTPWHVPSVLGIRPAGAVSGG